ncbi:MAG: BrnT family toxin [Stellaceae bacterium]
MEFAEIEWDENKRLSNIEKHGLDFSDAIDVVDGLCLWRSARTVAGEPRLMAIGMLDDVCVCVIGTLRGSVLRVISMRKARHEERQHYQEIFGG